MAQSYQTRQGSRIVALLAANRGNPLTAAEIASGCKGGGAPVGLATVYRHLEKLVASGCVKKIIPADASGVRYEYDGAQTVEECFYLKCEGCGQLIPLRCELLADVREHILADHGFSCNPHKSILYGTCGTCGDMPQHHAKDKVEPL